MSGIGQMGKQALRVAKNYTKGYSDTQTKVREATSNDPWGPSGTQMNEVSTLTFNQQDFIEIMEMMDKRLNDKGKNWRHVFKTLTLLDYLLHAGSENVVLYFRENLYIIKTLKEFQYIDEEGRDQGANVRQKAKDISNLLMDEARLRDERRSRAHMRDRMSGRQNSDPEPPRRAQSVPVAPRKPPEDSDLQKALELSRQSALDDAERAKRKAAGDAEMEEAMRRSREDESSRRNRSDDGTANALFDDGYDQHYNNNQFSLVDTSVPFQQTGIQPQFSSYNPYLAQQQQQHEDWMQQQQMMEMQRQQAEQQAQYEAMMQQQQQQQQYMQHQALLAQQTATPVQPQMTSYGSNNPFAQFASSAPSPAPAPARAPSAPPSSFSFNDYAAHSTATPPPPMPAQTTANTEAFRKPAPKRDDGQHAKLAALLAAGGGIDTFGNEGNLRVPMGSAYHTSNQLAANRTGMPSQRTGAANGFGGGGGSNPFGQQQPQQSSSEQPFFTI